MAQIDLRPAEDARQMELPLPPIAIETVLIERMLTVISENSSNVVICGESILQLQEKVDTLTVSMNSLIQAYQSLASGDNPGRAQGPSVEEAAPPGHPGYSVKEFAQLTKRSESYVYRLVAENQITMNMAGRITHQSLLRMRMDQAGGSRRQRRSKW